MPGQIAEAFVRIRPDFTAFRTELAAGLGTAVSGAGLAGAAAATTELSTAQLALFEASELSSAQMQLFNVAAAEEAVVAETAAASTVQLAASQAALAKSAKASTASMLGLGSASGRLDAALLGLRSAVGSSAVIGLGAGALAAIAFGKAMRGAIGIFSSFEEELNVFQATVGATSSEMERMRAEAEKLGADITLPAVSAADAATAMSQLARAGLSVEDSIAGARGVLQLATAANIDVAAATEIAANALNAFGLAGDQATRVADVLANAANSAQGSITDFGIAFAQSSAVARQVGIDLEDTAALLTILAQAGLRGSDAGTSLRTALLRLIAPSKEANDLIRQLGISIRDAQGNVRTDVFAQFGEATADLTPAVRDAAAAIIFGQDAIRAVAIAAREGRAGLTDMRDAMDETGTAAELAEARTKGLGGQFGALSSQAETTGIKIGQLASGPLEALITSAGLAVTALDKLLGGLIDLGNAADRLITGDEFDPATASLEELRAKIADLRSELAETDRFSGRVILGRKLEQESENLRAALEVNIDRLKDQRRQFQETGLSTGVLDDAIARLTRELEGLPTDAGDPVARGLDPVQRAVKNLRDALAGIVPEAEIDRQANRLRETMQKALTPQFRSDQLLRQITESIDFLRRGGETLGDEVKSITLKSISETVQQLKRLGVVAAPELKAIGKDLMDALGQGITEEEASVISAARQALRNAIRAADEQVRAAVTSARDNLQSLGNDLSQQLEEIIDVGPIGQKLDDLNAELDALVDRQSRRNLRFDLSQAQIDLEDMQQAIAQTGKLTPEQKKNQQEFLAPFKDKVADAKSEIKQFNLQDAIDQQEELLAAAKKTADEGIDRIIDAFEDGRITADQFNKRLSAIISGPLDTLKSKFGKNLGIEFTDEFFQNVKNLRDQVKELVGFLNIAPDTGVVSPGEAAAEGQQGVTAARVALNQAIKDATENTSENSDEMVTLLQEIKDALRGGGTQKAGGITGTPRAGKRGP